MDQLKATYKKQPPGAFLFFIGLGLVGLYMAYQFAFELETLSRREAKAARMMGQTGAVLFFMAFGLFCLVGSYFVFRRRNDPPPFLAFDVIGITEHTAGNSRIWIRWDEIKRLEYSGKQKEDVHLLKTDQLLGPQVVIPAHKTDRSGQEIFDHIAKRRPDLLIKPPNDPAAIDSTGWTGELFDRSYPSSKANARYDVTRATVILVTGFVLAMILYLLGY